MKKPSRLLLFLQGFIMLNLLWWAASRLIGPRMVPSPASVYLRAGNLWADGVVLHLVVSLWRAGAGLVLALVIGSALGLVMAHSSRWNRILHPLVYLTYPIPKTALLPVLLLLFGLGDSSKILLVTLIVIFQVIVSVRGAALSIPREHYHHITSLGAGPWQRFRHVTLPAILPELFTNTKNLEKRVHVLPKRLDEKVAELHLSKLGAKLTQLTKGQADYIGVSQNGPFKSEHYRY